ncbi:MAG: PilZ domain-containing protein [Gemmatimonadota bacterium]
MTFEFDRAHYRVTYPLAARPTFDWAGRSCVVLDVSEHGIRFLPPDSDAAKIGDPIKGIVRFRSGKTADVDGTVVRFFDGQVGVELKTDIPYRLIVDEQQYLVKRFPTRR